MIPLPKPPRVPYTYEEYCLLPSDGQRYELINGELYVTPAPVPFHQTVSRRLQYALMTLLEQTGIALVFNAPCDLILADSTIVQPDLLILRKDRAFAITDRGIEAPPDIIVEILSPSTRANDTVLKRAAYTNFGIPEYWLVDPAHGMVDVLLLEGEGYRLVTRFDRTRTLTSPTFAEIAVPLAGIFEPH